MGTTNLEYKGNLIFGIIYDFQEHILCVVLWSNNNYIHFEFLKCNKKYKIFEKTVYQIRTNAS